MFMRKRVCRLTPEQTERRGAVWAIGSFVFCPCHLPVTLWVIGTVLSGTALGVLVSGHRVAAGVLVSIVWIAGTLHGFNLMRRGRMAASTRGASSQSRLLDGEIWR